MKKRDPRPGHFLDESLLIDIWRVNLDMMWSHEPSTVEHKFLQFERAARLAQGLELHE